MREVDWSVLRDQDADWSVCYNEPCYFVVVIILSVKYVILQFLEQCSVVCLTDNMVGN